MYLQIIFIEKLDIKLHIFKCYESILTIMQLYKYLQIIFIEKLDIKLSYTYLNVMKVS